MLHDSLDVGESECRSIVKAFDVNYARYTAWSRKKSLDSRFMFVDVKSRSFIDKL